MELMGELVNNQLTLYIPVALVLVGAILVFTFGFKSAEQPPFDKLSSTSSEDRKSTGKKRKPKEKKTANGFAVPVTESKSEKSSSKDKESKRSPTKETPGTPKQAKKQDTSSPKQANKKTEPPKRITVEEVKNKKNLKQKHDEKPADFDDGSWETVPSKNDKKKKQDSPAKKDKKPKKPEKNENKEKSVEIEKLVKEEVDKQLQEDNKENKTNDNIKKVPAKVINKEPEEMIPIVEEKKPKKEKKPKIEKEQVDQAAKPTPPTAKAEPKQVSEPETTEAPASKQPAGGAVFDELGDMWTEAKAAKKSKKKSRRDN